jgi:hypothetical protein
MKTFACAVVFAAAAAASGQSTPFWLTDGDSHNIFVVQNGAIQQVINQQGQHHGYPLAISGDVRVTAYLPNGVGGHYDLAGNYLGNDFNNDGVDAMTDGTTDGVQYNYGIRYYDGSVFRYDLNWDNPQQLFAVGSDFGAITYDSSDGTLWVKNRNTNATVNHYDAAGNFLGGFSLGANGNFTNWSLAYEEATDSLWCIGVGNDTIFQFDKSGNTLQQLNVGTSGNILGGEMSIRGVPAPGAAALLGVAGLAAGRRRRS